MIGDRIGRGAAAQLAVTGKTPNLAARLKETCPPGTLVIAEAHASSSKGNSNATISARISSRASAKPCRRGRSFAS